MSAVRPKIRVEVPQGEYKATADADELYTLGLGPCLGVCLAYENHGFMLHLEDARQQEDSLLMPFLDDLRRSVPRSARRMIHPLVAGACLDSYKAFPEEERFVHADIRYARQLVLRKLRGLGFGVPMIRWCELGRTQNLFLGICAKKVVLMTTSRADASIETGREIISVEDRFWPFASLE